MRARRPEKFSDSIEENDRVLDRSQLEYHLSTLTNRSQETQFERFARRLAECEICPNLKPHTGPTGGGDSKVDTETYPVAEVLALGWYVGNGAAAEERWAFAFSAKKDWRPKLKSDIQKIAATGRPYAKAFFVSNQYVPDKKRAAVEDSLRAKYAIDVHVLDLSWILDRVFAAGRQALAVDELHLSPALKPQIRKGPNDTEREAELQATELRIASALADPRLHGHQLVTDCLETARLAKSLERPRVQVDGLFSRAARVARKMGTPHQQLLVAYHHAWTLFWWYDDFSGFSEHYEKVEGLARDTTNSYELELLNNLWGLLRGAIRDGHLDPKEGKFEARTSFLQVQLKRVSQIVSRPSAALQAKTLLVLMGIDPDDPKTVESAFAELKVLVRGADGLLGYPLKPLITLLCELGPTLEARGWDELFETLVEITTRRDGEVSGAKLLFERGARQFRDEKHYDAIRTLGRVLQRLCKHETRLQLSRALYLCGRAYERVGLLWAARGSVLMAASVASAEFWVYEQVTVDQATCYKRLKWLELQLGRIPHALAWYEADQAVVGALVRSGVPEEGLREDEMAFDAVLGILFLRAEIDVLHQVDRLPDVFSELGLYNARIALLYALGHESEVSKTLAEVGATESPPEIDHFERWRDQPAAESLPDARGWQPDGRILQSRILGCRLECSAENVPSCLALAESILAALEALLATAHEVGIVAREPTLLIDIRLGANLSVPFRFSLDDTSGPPALLIECSDFNPHRMKPEEMAGMKDCLAALLPQVLSHAFSVGHEDSLPRLLGEEKAAERAVGFTSSFVVLANVLGDTPKTTIHAWCQRADAFPLLRGHRWDFGRGSLAVAASTAHEPIDGNQTNAEFWKSEPPPGLWERATARHDQMEAISPIREVLWDRARWSGTAFAVPQALDGIPALVLLFRDENPAQRIFDQWQRDYGERDEKNQIRIVILRGVSTSNPHSYRIIIGPNMAAAEGRRGLHEERMYFAGCRINTMEPTSSENLEMFLRRYERVQRYALLPGVSSGASAPRLLGGSLIVKRELLVKDAWQVGPGDCEMVAIRAEDTPIIPPDAKSVPVFEILARKRARQAR